MHQAQPRLDRVFHALADPTRRGMLTLLAKGRRTAGELGRPFSISQPSCSRHISVLEDAGLVHRRVEGRTHYFHLQAAPLRTSESWISAHRRLWEGSLERLDGLLAELQQKGQR
jgi:DNA-binding transcriptional ArsR family regulator